MPLGQDVLQVHVPSDVAPGDAAQADRVVRRWIDHDAFKALLEARARRRAEIGLVIRDAEQHAHVWRNEPVVEPQATGERTTDVVPTDRAEIELEGARLEVVVGELREKTLGGQAVRPPNGQETRDQTDRPSV